MWIFDKLPTLSRRDALASCSSPPPHPRHCDISSEKPTSRKNCNSALWNAMVAPLRYEEKKFERKSIENFQLSTRMPTQRFGREGFPLVPGRGKHPQQQEVTIMITSHVLSLVEWCFLFSRDHYACTFPALVASWRREFSLHGPTRWLDS